MKSSEKSKLLKYLKTQPVMSLATSDGKNLWSATVYFVADDNLNFYFMSGPKTTHTQNTKSNPKVSFTIASSDQWPDDEKFGVQASGTCSHFKDIKGLVEMLKLWNTKFAKKPAPSLEKIKIGWPFYKIEVNKLKVFDSVAKETEELYSL